MNEKRRSFQDHLILNTLGFVEEQFFSLVFLTKYIKNIFKRFFGGRMRNKKRKAKNTKRKKYEMYSLLIIQK